MIEIARQDRDTLIHECHCSRRLAVRIGALLSRQVGVSMTLAEAAHPGSSLESLLLKRELLEASDIRQCIASLSALDEFAELTKEFPLQVIDQDELSVLIAEEEALAEAGWHDTNGAEHLPAKESLPSPLPAPVFSESTPRNDAGASAFSPEEVARLRVSIFAGSDSTEKVAALRKFAFASVPQDEKLRVFLQAAASDTAPLRSAAALGLRSFGLSPAIADTIRLLSEENAEERSMAAERLRDLAPASDELGKDTILMALAGILRDPHAEDALAQQTLSILHDILPHLNPSRVKQDDLLRLILDRMIGASQNTLSAIRAVLQSLNAIHPEWITGIMASEFMGSQSVRFRGAMLELLAGIPMDDNLRASLIAPAVETFLQLKTETNACLMAGRFLLEAGEEGIRALADSIARADTAHQRHIIRMIDNAYLTHEYSAAIREEIAQKSLAVMTSAPKQVRADLIETRILARNDISIGMRAEIASAFLQDVRNYSRWPLSETMENSLVQLGEAAIPALLTSLLEHRESPDSAILAAALGRIGMSMAGSDAPQSQPQCQTLVREMQKLSFSSIACRDALRLAMGRICSGPGVPHDVANLTMRSLLSSLEGNPNDATSIEALGLVCSGNGPGEQDIRMIAEIALQHIHNAQPDPNLETTHADGEDMFVMGDEVDIYAKLIPGCLQALESIVLSPRCPTDLRDRLLEDLLDNWLKASRFEIQWGPAAVTQLTATLGRLGTSGLVTDSQRIRIANTLAHRIDDMPVLDALAELIAQPDRLPQMDRLGGAVILRLLKLLEENENLRLEDHEDYLRILAHVARRGRFEVRGGNADRLLRRTLEAFQAGLRRGVPGCLKQLQSLRDAGTLPESVITEISDMIRSFTALRKV